MIEDFQLYYILFIGVVAGFSYWLGYREGELDGVENVVEILKETGQITIEVVEKDD